MLREVETIKDTVSQTAEMKYPQSSLLAREIAQQPDLWPDTLQRVASYLSNRASVLGRVIVTGAGTSAYAGQCIAEAWPGAYAIATTDLLLLSLEEILARVPGLDEGGLLISLARSGNSPESAAVVQRMQRLFPAVTHLAIVCNPQSALAKLDGVSVLQLHERTNDQSLAMTSSFSNLALAGLALCNLDGLSQHIPQIATNAREHLEFMFETATEIAADGARRFVVLASTMHGLAREMTLKSLELTAGGTVGLAESFLAFRHGPISFLREDTPILCLLSTDPLKRQYEDDLVKEFATRGMRNVCLIGGEAGTDLPHRWQVPALAPLLPDALRAPFEVVFVQLLAYAHSVRAGIDPDDPSPDGQVTRVVRPFTVYS